jgi:hypothetical protein
MSSKRNWIVLLSAFFIFAALSLALLSGVFAAANKLADVNYMAFIPLVLNQPPYEADPLGELQTFTPIWELGASSADPTVGAEGTIHGWYTKTNYQNGTKIDLEIYIKVRRGYAGVGTGSYEIYLPDELEPESDWYVGHANAWIAGGSISEFDGSVKWTMRNTVKGPKLIFTFDGQEWSPTHPKNFADLKLRANIKYWLQSMEPSESQLESLEE